MKAMRKREAEEEGKWSRVMRKREDVEEEDEDEEDDEEDEVKTEENEPDHETDAEEEHRSILQGEANPEEDFVAESFFY